MREEYFTYDAEGTLMEEADLDNRYQNALRVLQVTQVARSPGKLSINAYLDCKNEYLHR